ncbi:hypothetical protein CPB84DRAFT_1746494 [Gymnopilus junonius]|uniref:Uncharacterized protein n=1 Tax=Gymnopilus junonius TaxID=109634 RepID=A0A9P5TNG1_GYMJU|nr:hypothetical protein CPB84DRAFT_1746494 [Gymnopilus junonius]
MSKSEELYTSDAWERQALGIINTIFGQFSKLCWHSGSIPSSSQSLDLARCDRAKTWAIAATPQAIKKTGQTTKIRYQQANKDPWDDNPAIATKRASDRDPKVGTCPIFIRGMRIAIDTGSWTQHILKNEPPRLVPHFNLLSAPTLGIRAKILTIIERWRDYPEEFRPVRTQILFHPLILTVLQINATQTPNAVVAIAEDSIWPSIQNKPRDGTLDETVRHIVGLLETCTIDTRDGNVLPSCHQTRTCDFDTESKFVIREHFGLLNSRLIFILNKGPNHDAQYAPLHILGRIQDILNARQRRKEIFRQVCNALPGPDYQEIPIPN